MSARKLIHRYWAYQFFFSLLPWIPIYYEYQRKIGLSDAQIFGIQSIYYIAFCLLEIPTGLAADRFGFKNCLKWGAVLLVGANLLPIFAPGYAGFLAHFLLIGFSRSLASGASSAYLYEALIEAGESPETYKKVEGDARAVGLLGKVAFFPLAAWWMTRWLTAPYWITALAAIVSVYFVWTLPELKREPQQTRSKGIVRELPGVCGRVVRSPLLLLVIVQGVAVFILSRIIQTNLFQPILHDRGFALSAYGWVAAGATLFEAAGSGGRFVRRMSRSFSDLNSVFVLTLFLSASLGLVSISGPIGTIAGLLFFSAAAGAAFPIQRQLLNDAVSEAGASAFRATVLSVESIVDRAVCAWVVSWIGWFVSEGRVTELLRLSAWASIAVMTILFGLLRLSERIALRVEE